MSLLFGLKRKIAVSLLVAGYVLLVPLPLLADSSEPVAVTVAQVKYEQRTHTIRNSGRISHKNEIRLSFKTGGLIENIKVEEGDVVTAGQVLATLDLEEIDAQQNRAAANHKNAVDDFSSFSKLYEDDLVSSQELHRIQLVADNAAAELQIANFNKKLSVIRAPADGRILKRFVESSELILAGQPVLLLASQKHGSVVRVGLIDQDIVKVAVGDLVEIFLDAYPGRQFSGSVSEVALSTDSMAGTFEVEIQIEDQGFSLRSGLIARVEITPSSDALQFYLPIESIFKADNGMATVFVLDEPGQVVHTVEVQIVKFLVDEVIVEGSLKATDRVIKLGAPYLTDGRSVSIIDES